MAVHGHVHSPTKGIPMTDLHVVATIPIKTEAAEQAATALAELAVATRAEEGCLSYDLYESLAVPGTFVTVELWRSQQDLDAHLASPHVEQALTDYAEQMTGPVAVHPLRPA